MNHCILQNFFVIIKETCPQTPPHGSTTFSKAKKMNQNAEQFLSTEDFVLYVEEDADQAAAESIADELQINRIPKSSAGSLPARCLLMDAEGLSLVEGAHTLRGDFARFLPRLVPNNLNHELLVKAARLRGAQGPLSAVDATAGLGEDAFLLAAAGFQVWLYERNPVIAALLQDALRRGMKNPELAPVLGRMHFHRGDSIVELPRLDFAPDIVVLDPMFPDRKKSGLIRKKFQMLHQLENPCSEETELLTAAFSCHPRRIVIKRPLKGPCLAGQKPAYTLKGRAIRYDCIVPPQATGNKESTGHRDS